PMGIAFAFVATHNHFVLDRGGKVFKQSAPVIKLPEGASEDEHLELLGVLNSSTACFWLKQVCHGKGNGGVNEGYRGDEWEEFYEFTGTKLRDFPIPDSFPLSRARELDQLAIQHEKTQQMLEGVGGPPTSGQVLQARERWQAIREKMIAVQEELDWEVYYLYGLLDEKLTAPEGSLPEIRVGERAFEISLARKVEFGETETEWFRRHGVAPITEVPPHWPEGYRRIVRKRIELIESRRDIALVERPGHKRRWSTETWEKQEESALRAWMLDQCENRSLWFANDEYGTEQPRTMTASQLADQLRRNEDFVAVARLYAGDDADLSKVVAEITQDEHVPHLAALRYKDPSGLRKRSQWENVWEQQREEDRTGKRLDIPVPPKYTSADFLRPSYWRNRGKLDVPKERCVSYPGSGAVGGSSMLVGCVVWDHREQAQVGMLLLEERGTQVGWDVAGLAALLAGLAEVLPWVRQWR